MTHEHQKLTKLVQGLEAVLASQSGSEVRLLPENQLLIRFSMMRNPITANLLKATYETPSPEGYEIYVQIQPLKSETVALRPSQKFTFPGIASPDRWDQSSMTLQLETGVTSREWQVVNSRDETISIRIRCGKRAVTSNVNSVLLVIEKELLT